MRFFGFTSLWGRSTLTDDSGSYYTSIILFVSIVFVAARLALRYSPATLGTTHYISRLVAVGSNIAIVLSISHVMSLYLDSSPGATNSDAHLNTFRLHPIDISSVLKQNLALAKHSWEHGVLTHALLELQNPELTVFAGPGYGFDLRQPYKDRDGRAVMLEPFPGGMLPKCAGGSGDSRGMGWGRYDDWARVKGLREGARRISTVVAMRGRGRRENGEEERPWLFRSNESSAADSANLGWAALLLERAGVADLMNPLPPGSERNAYGEAVDEFVRWLFEENPRYMLDCEEDGGDCGSAGMREVGGSDGKRWALSHRVDVREMWADSVFMVPPFLAAYAVARQDEKWLWEAVQQILAYHSVLAKRADGFGLWKHIARQSDFIKIEACCEDEGLWLTGNAWVLAGIARLIAVLERWHKVKVPNEQSTDDGSPDARKRAMALNTLQDMANNMLASLGSVIQRNPDNQLLQNYLHPTNEASTQAWMFGDAAGTALLVSSVYRLAQIGMFNDMDIMNWADDLYNSVARNIGKGGLLHSVATVSKVPATHAVNGTSEGQSFAIMMYAARRDCVQMGICRATAYPGWLASCLSVWPSVLIGGVGLLLSKQGPLRI